MNAVGIDVSKGKSTVAVLRPFGEVAASPFEVAHNNSELTKLAALIKKLPGESRAVMESTGNYSEPIARFFHNEGIYVSVVNALLVHDYGGNTIRKAKTDKKDAIKLASYAIDRWLDIACVLSLTIFLENFYMAIRLKNFAVRHIKKIFMLRKTSQSV